VNRLRELDDVASQLRLTPGKQKMAAMSSSRALADFRGFLSIAAIAEILESLRSRRDA
jgi:hypothetical protein